MGKPHQNNSFLTTFALLVAQGFGAGRVAFGPGTFGTLVGIVWTLVLVGTGSVWGFAIGTVAGLALSVWLCGAAEKILREQDPPSVVLDEIAAMPVCFAPWVIRLWLREGVWPYPEELVLGRAWIWTLILFALFRFFDILKPPPIRQSQRLPGGWGVTADDVLAAVAVALLSLLFVS